METKQFVIWNIKKYLLFQAKNSGYLNVSKLSFLLNENFFQLIEMLPH